MADTYPIEESWRPQQMAEDLRAAVAALTARTEDLIDRFDRLQAVVNQTQIQTAQNIVETRAVVARLDRLNGSVQDTIGRVDTIEHRCGRHEDESASRKLDRDEIVAIRTALGEIQTQRQIEQARRDGGAAVWAHLRPWVERAAWLAIGIGIYLVLDHASGILSHIKVGP